MSSHCIRALFRIVFLILLAQIWTIAAGAQDSPETAKEQLLPDAPVAAPEVSASKFREAHPSASRINRRAFVVMSAAAYGFAFLDMRETKAIGSGLIEHDPLARPFTQLPTPAYYVTGAALVTGVNLLAWKLAHTRKLHKIWWVPQAACSSGNLYGFSKTKSRL
jgi:hypothetical protein